MTSDKSGQHYLGPVKETLDTEIAELSVQDKQGKWHWSKAMIEAATVVVWSEEVAELKKRALRLRFEPTCESLKQVRPARLDVQELG